MMRLAASSTLAIALLLAACADRSDRKDVVLECQRTSPPWKTAECGAVNSSDMGNRQ